MTTKNDKVEPGIWRTKTGAYQVMYRDTFGKQRAKTFDRLVDARTFKADMRVRKQRGDLVDPSVGRMKFSEWAGLYLEQKISLRERTKDKYESACGHICSQLSLRRVSVQSRVETFSGGS